MKVRDFSKIFFAILFLHLAVIYRPESEVLLIISKPLLLFSLLAFFVHRTARFNLGQNHWIAAALFSSLVGDVLLLREGEWLFPGGVIAFALAHLFFIVYYFRQSLKLTLFVFVAVIIPLAGIFVLYRYVNIPSESAPFLYGYAALLGFHFLKSVQLAVSVTGSDRLPALGTLLFMVSNVLLVFARFNGGNRYWNMAIMLTYALAQYFITIGLIRYISDKAEKERNSVNNP